MKINVIHTFLHGEARYEEGQTANVSNEEGRYFVDNGWATSEEYTGVAGNQDIVKDIQVQDGTVGNTGEMN